MEGVVLERFVSKKGTPCLKIGNQVYVATKCDVSEIRPGDNISYEGHTFGDGKIWEIDSWKLLQGQSKYPPSVQPSNGIAAPEASPTVSGPIAGGVADAERPCISNWGAELIKAGLVKDPADLGRWVVAIKNMLRS